MQYKIQGNIKSKLTDEMLLVGSDGQVIKRRSLAPWLLLYNTKLDYDPVSDQFLFVLLDQKTNTTKPALANANNLTISTIKKHVTHARWLPAGANIKVRQH